MPYSYICSRNPSGDTFSAAIHLEILFERILKTWQSSQDNSLEALILYFLTMAVSAFDLP